MWWGKGERRERTRSGGSLSRSGWGQRLMRGQSEKKAKDPKRNNGGGGCLREAPTRNRVQTQPYPLVA